MRENIQVKSRKKLRSESGWESFTEKKGALTTFSFH
jgi:hypothetical protein